MMNLQVVYPTAYLRPDSHCPVASSVQCAGVHVTHASAWWMFVLCPVIKLKTRWVAINVHT